jgi:hypothetical protein
MTEKVSRARLRREAKEEDCFLGKEKRYWRWRRKMDR